MKIIKQTLISAVIILTFGYCAFCQNVSKPVDVESFKLGDTCVVRIFNSTEIAGVLTDRNSNTIQLTDKHVNYSVKISDIVSIEYFHKPGEEIQQKGEELDIPSYDYYIHLKDRSILRCDPVSITGDSLLTIVKKSRNKNLYADDINTVVKINHSQAVPLGFIGGAVGLGLGYLISHSIAYSDYQEPVPGEFNLDMFGSLRELSVVLGTIAGTAAGAVIGAVIGNAFGIDDIYSLEKKDKQQKIRELKRIIEEK